MTPFEKHARAFIASRSTEGTQYLYGLDLNDWLAFCARRDVDPANAELEDSTVYRDTLKNKKTGKPLEPITKRRTLLALSRIYRYNVSKKVASWNPFDPDELSAPPPSTIGKTRAVPRNVAAAIIAKIESGTNDIHLRDAAIAQLLRTTGLRVSSVVAVRRKAIFRDGQRMTLQTTAKKKDMVDVEVPEPAAIAVERWLARAPESIYLFPARGDRGHLDTKAVNKRLVHYSRAIGVTPFVSPHQFRAAFITRAISLKIAMSDISASVHHSSTIVTQRYDRGVRGGGVASAVAKSFSDEEKK